MAAYLLDHQFEKITDPVQRSKYNQFLSKRDGEKVETHNFFERQAIDALIKDAKQKRNQKGENSI